MKTNEVITIKVARAEMKKERESINQALKVLCTYLDTCPSVKQVVHSKAFALSCATDIYDAMGVGKEYEAKVSKVNENGEKVTEIVKRVRKASADLCLRWFINNQEANAEIYRAFSTKKENEKKGEK